MWEFIKASVVCERVCVCIIMWGCIYRTGELISPDIALQALQTPAVPAADIILLMEDDEFINAYPQISTEDEAIYQSEVYLHSTG